MKNKKNGFTLIELIVVITIIAVMTVVGVVSYSGTSKKSRDSKRMADLYKLGTALELYRQGTQSTYPSILSKLTPTYIQSIPTGPKGETYTYTQSGGGYTYTLKTTMEDAGSTNIAGFYQVTNP